MGDTLSIKRNHPDARMPTRATSGSVGYDLYSLVNVTIEGGKRKLVSTGITAVFPPGCYGRIAPRSGLSMMGIDIGGGVIDRDYTGTIYVLMINNGEEPYVVSSGDRIAQLILERITICEVVEIHSYENTARGGNGFGSSGN